MVVVEVWSAGGEEWRSELKGAEPRLEGQVEMICLMRFFSFYIVKPETREGGGVCVCVCRRLTGKLANMVPNHKNV